MKFSAVLFTAILAATAAAIPQESSKTTSSAVPTPSSSYPPEVMTCLEGCAEDDVVCRAHCLGAPAPTEEDMANVTECVAACPQGDGSDEDSQKYRQCQDECIRTKFSPNPSPSNDDGASGTGTDSAPTSTGSGDSDNEDGGASGTGTGKGGANSTNEEAPTNTDTGAASGLAVGGSFAGLVAALAAFLTL